MNSANRSRLAMSLVLMSFFGVANGGSERDDPAVRVNIAGGESSRDANDLRDLLVRRVEDGRPRNPNPNGTSGGTTPGMAKNDYVLKTYAIHNTNAIDVQSYLLRSLVYEGGIAEVMGKQDLKDADGNPVQYLFVTAPDFMIPGIDEMIARVDVKGFAFYDGTSNGNAAGKSGCTAYVGKHRTAGELKAILAGTELGNIGQFYYAPFADPSLNTIYISENPSDIADDLSALESFDRPPLQAEFEVTIYEVDQDHFEDVGLDFDAWKRAISGTFTLHESSGDGKKATVDSIVGLEASVLAEFLNYMVGQGDAKITTRAKLLSVNAEDNPGALSGGARSEATASPAVLHDGRILPFEKVVSRAGEPGDTHVESVLDPNVFEGFDLSIRPFICAESITADIAVTVNSMVGFDRSGRVPNVTSRNSHSTLHLKPGTEYLIGSFERKTQVEVEDGIFLLRDIPWMGALFRRTTTADRESRWFVYVKPRIVS